MGICENHIYKTNWQKSEDFKTQCKYKDAGIEFQSFSGETFQIKSSSAIVNKYFVGRDQTMKVLEQLHNTYNKLVNGEYEENYPGSLEKYKTASNGYCGKEQPDDGNRMNGIVFFVVAVTVVLLLLVIFLG